MCECLCVNPTMVTSTQSWSQPFVIDYIQLIQSKVIQLQFTKSNQCFVDLCVRWHEVNHPSVVQVAAGAAKRALVFGSAPRSFTPPCYGDSLLHSNTCTYSVNNEMYTVNVFNSDSVDWSYLQHTSLCRRHRVSKYS